jgi:hypothetical protein
MTGVKLGSFSLLALALAITAGCSDAPTSAPARRAAPAAASASKIPLTEWPTGEKLTVNAVINPIYDWTLGEGHPLVYGSRPMGPARWPAHPNVKAQAQLYVVAYPIGTTVTKLQCYDIPQENCPDHGPTIAGGAMQVMPNVYRVGVLGHDHLGPPHGSDAPATASAVLVLFTSTAAANSHLTTKAQVEAAEQAGDVVLIPAPDFSFHNSPVNGLIYEKASPWICPAYTTCTP